MFASVPLLVAAASVSVSMISASPAPTLVYPYPGSVIHFPSQPGEMSTFLDPQSRWNVVASGNNACLGYQNRTGIQSYIAANFGSFQQLLCLDIQTGAIFRNESHTRNEPLSLTKDYSVTLPPKQTNEHYKDTCKAYLNELAKVSSETKEAVKHIPAYVSVVKYVDSAVAYFKNECGH